MSFIKNPKATAFTAVIGAAAMLIVGSLNAASAAEVKTSDNKEAKPVCAEGQRNLGSTVSPICVSSGASAYEIAVKLGFSGTPAEWLASLKGQQGIQGIPGINGKDGKDGLAGSNGTNGTNGTNGLDGKDGKDGSNGTDGANGATGPQGPAGANANVIGTACSFDTTKENRTVHHTGVWGFSSITNEDGQSFAAFGCVMASGGND